MHILRNHEASNYRIFRQPWREYLAWNGECGQNYDDYEVNSYVKNLTFKVSAKTARLFGRENASSAEAAISELIKNTYDADATACFVLFVPTYLSSPDKISKEEYKYLLARNQKVEEFYKVNDDDTVSLRNTDANYKTSAYSVIQKLVDLWIIDNGTGMSSETIERCWMVIGTDDKEKNIFSKKGRTRTGAKGIGRFALDRLGNRCSLYSGFLGNGGQQYLKWEVDWSDFDEEGKILDDISARLEENGPPLNEVLEFVEYYPVAAARLRQLAGKISKWTTGTAIRIGLLRDSWTRSHLDRLNKMLATLVPPIEQKELNLFHFDSSSPSAYGNISAGILDDYDYRLEAAIADNGEIHFDLYRNELQHKDLDPGLFNLQDMQHPRYSRLSFKLAKLPYTKQIKILFPEQTADFYRKVRELGPFKVTLHFFKMGTPSRRDAEIYPYRKFQPGPRKAWLEEFGGIKIYRDNFAVRPYGEIEGRAFDWLSLGKRVALSPVAASRKGWKVSPQNIAGTVSISRQANRRLYDQTNREGIIENAHFAVFRQIILRVIQEFEDDRSRILFNLNKLYQKTHKTEAVKTEGAITAQRLVKMPQQATVEDARKLAKAFVAQQEEIKDLREEHIMLRALATLGTVLVSFSHEMGQLQNTMGSRSAVLSDILTSYISSDELADAPSAFHPYAILEDWQKEDQRVKQWFRFALSSIQSERRRRKRVSLKDHLQHMASIWKGFLEPRGVSLEISFIKDSVDAFVLAFEIDLDSIFNNLILNSVEIFLSPRHSGNRRIDIALQVRDEVVHIKYGDNGPGLHPAIRNPNDIFNFGVTTKVGPNGEPTGTGLGLWILSSVVHSYGGSCKAYRRGSKNGFRLELELPALRKGH